LTTTQHQKIDALPSRHVETDYGMKTVVCARPGDPEIKFVNTGALAIADAMDDL